MMYNDVIQMIKPRTQKVSWIYSTVLGLGSRIFCINEFASGENQNGEENWPALICMWNRETVSFTVISMQSLNAYMYALSSTKVVPLSKTY